MSPIAVVREARTRVTALTSLFLSLYSGSKFSGALTEFTNVNTNGFWEGAIDDVTVNGVSLGLAGRTAILDTVC